MFQVWDFFCIKWVEGDESSVEDIAGHMKKNNIFGLTSEDILLVKSNSASIQRS
ncbi:hypothetical protein BRARA_B02318 [Brassica rapa]|uniref:Uncharacterized protein n=1 Tax=Brassica campestris TaxID=3711 RepID=A0A398ACP8_BRACM|nr:hypothetical protein BRARA_B02318 [Brassica rapa]